MIFGTVRKQNQPLHHKHQWVSVSSNMIVRLNVFIRHVIASLACGASIIYAILPQ